MWIACVAFLLASSSMGYAAPLLVENAGFEEGEPGGQAPGWIIPADQGYTVEQSPGGHTGQRALHVRWASQTAPGWTSVAQSLAAIPARGQLVRMRGYVRVEGVDAGAWVGLWLRVDRPDRQHGFFDNMEDRPILVEDWQPFEIVGRVDTDATALVFGMLVVGHANAWLDDVSLEVFTPTDLPPDPPSPEAGRYLDAALAILRRHSVMRRSVDWTAVEQDAAIAARGAREPKDTYKAIRGALAALGDHHSFFEPPAAASTEAQAGADAAPAVVRREDGHLGYVQLPPYEGTDAAAARAWATRTQQALGAIAEGSCGWIVDLRQDEGGNMYPMIAGIGPILGEGLLGHFVDGTRNSGSWSYRRGAARAGWLRIVRVPHPLRLAESPPVAVLTSANTASSGEAVAVSFRGRPSTRSFGAATAGLSSGNAFFTLRDGAVLVLTTAYDADRDGVRYGGSLLPDVPVADGPGDPVLLAARAWLEAQPACAGAQGG